MKKIYKYLVFLLVMFLVKDANISAKSIAISEVKTSTYIIGNMMFTRDSNSSYQG